MDMSSNFITIYLEDLWKREYPKQDRGFIHTCEWEELTVPIDQLTAGKPADMKKGAILSEAPVGRQSGLSAPCQRQRRGDRRPAPILGLSADGVSDGDGLSEQAVGHAHSGIGPASERRTLCQPTVYAAGVELRQSFPHTGRFMWTRNTNRQAGTLSVRPAIKRQPKI